MGRVTCTVLVVIEPFPLATRARGFTSGLDSYQLKRPNRAGRIQNGVVYA